jgi:cell wall-associated NlpC family hydrolase
MGHKLLFTCAFLLALAGIAPRAAAQTSEDYRFAAALQALVSVGVRYHSGGASPDTGFDCSGLVAHVYEHAWGLTLPRARRSSAASAGR